jgi:hypothetical protein
MRKCRRQSCRTTLPTAKLSDRWQAKGFCSCDCMAGHGMDKATQARERQDEKQARESRAARAAERKARREADKAARDKIKTRREWVDIAQRLINAIVVIEDAEKGCISCIDGQVNRVKDSGHYFHKGNKYRVSPLTLLRLNLNGQCVQCNQHEGGKQHEYRIGFIARYGEAAFDDLCEFKRKVDCKEIKPLTIPQVQGLISDYKAKLAELKTRQPAN